MHTTQEPSKNSAFPDPDAESGRHLSWLGPKLGAKARKSVIYLVDAVKNETFPVNSPGPGGLTCYKMNFNERLHLAWKREVALLPSM